MFVRRICSDNMNIKMDLRGMGWVAVDWINLAKDRDQYWALVDTVINIRFP
jgi:hypothetical protein